MQEKFSSLSNIPINLNLRDIVDRKLAKQSRERLVRLRMHRSPVESEIVFDVGGGSRGIHRRKTKLGGE